MGFATRRRARAALWWGAVGAYALLMIIAIGSVRQDSDGLRVLWPAAVMGAGLALLRRKRPVVLVLMPAGVVAVIVAMGSGDVSFGPRLALAVAVGMVAAAHPPRI